MIRQILLALFAVSFALLANGAPIPIGRSDNENRDFVENVTKGVASVWHKVTSKIGNEFHHSTSLPSGFAETVTASAGHTYTVITTTGGPAVTLTNGKHGEVTSFAGHKFTIVKPTPTVTPTITSATTHTVTHSHTPSAIATTTTSASSSTTTGTSSTTTGTSSSTTGTSSTATSGSSTSSGSSSSTKTSSTGFPTSTFFNNSAPAGARVSTAFLPMLASLATILGGSVLGALFAL
ncbi:hypothetical protein BT96DRAFT_1012877 [Gymnopus androsaceus JB14]|uniref:Uncharacterized protein n=1 Tax=Gymnopus androsaceus JB14 TaxID=1447944 RepID=A0A6A4IF77_9AGAR|nr:hypothetical protein BT96DRAFT_1012877 [Gymnopus androsaceus JB14]